MKAAKLTEVLDDEDENLVVGPASKALDKLSIVARKIRRSPSTVEISNVCALWAISQIIDVETRVKVTFLMLQRALKYHKVNGNSKLHKG